MIFRRLEELAGSAREVRPQSGNWLSRRLLLKNDGLGFSFHDTVVYGGTETLIHYRHHVEGVYCVEGEGEVEVLATGEKYPLRPGTIYALDGHERHYLRARTDLRIICVFIPPLTGEEVHQADGSYPAGEGESPGMKIVYLNLEGHPRGNYMLQRLVEEGFPPAAVIEEASPLAEKGRTALSKELEKFSDEEPLPPSLEDVIGGRDLPCFKVKNHNDDDCKKVLRKIGPDLIVLGDTRIIREDILKIPKLGILNVHPGYLPDVRGNTPYLWAIHHGLPQGCSVHFIDEGVDTGPIVLRQRIRCRRGWTYPRLLVEINRLCGDLLAEALHLLGAGMAHGIPQENFARRGKRYGTFALAPPDVKAAAVAKFEAAGRDRPAGGS